MSTLVKPHNGGNTRRVKFRSRRSAHDAFSPSVQLSWIAMDTAEALKRAMQALRDADIPQELWETALPLALADIRGATAAPPPVTPPPASGSGPLPRKAAASKKARAPRGGARASSATDEPSILIDLPDEGTLFKKVEAETGVTASDLSDLFHIESGRVQIKVPGRQLGANGKAGTITIAGLLAGLVFAGTQHRKLPFREINEHCKAKNVFHDKNSSTYIKATPGFAAVGPAGALYLTTKTGWQDEFARAAGRALNKPPVS